MQETIFTKIVKGEIPSHKIYEDEYVFAFLDIHPKTPGHTLVIPKRQVEFVWDMDEQEYNAAMDAVKRIALRLREEFGYTYVGELVFGMDVPHAHIHVYGFNKAEEARHIPDPDQEPDHASLANVAKKLAL